MIVITFIIYNLVRLSSTRSGSGSSLSEKGTRSASGTRKGTKWLQAREETDFL